MENLESTSLAKDNRVGVFMFFLSVDEQKRRDHKETRTYYGVNVFKMREILKLKTLQVTEIAGSNDLSLGMVSLRGEIIPLINLPLWLGYILPKDYTSTYNILICDFNHHKIGLVIGDPYRIEMKSWEDIETSMAYQSGKEIKISNHTKTQETNDICFIVDIEQLLSEVMPEKEKQIQKDIESINSDYSWITKDAPILIAEDSKVARKHLENLFKKINVKAEFFENGKYLLDRVKEIGISNLKNPVIITDLEMPIVSGHKVIQEIRKLNKNIPILVNSSMTSENNKREVLSLGATDFIGKTDSALIVSLLKKYVK